jgi:holin, SPP1 family
MSEKISATTIARTAVLILALANQILAMFGKQAFPFTNDQVYLGITTVFTVVAVLRAWWKNNSFTKEAIKADIYKNKLKHVQDGADAGSWE